jgi:hypothetical protein
MNLKSIFISLAALYLIGCGSSEPVAHEETPLFKGKVVKVQYRLVEGDTVLIDDAGKETVLEGHPGIPCSEIEIFKHGREYEVVQVGK